MIKILIADDSVMMRMTLEKSLSKNPDFEVIGFCSNGQEVLEKVSTLKPDVLPLDIEMPKMNGLEVLEKLMHSNPIPVIMVSSLTTEGADETIKALELGAIDVFAKPGSLSSVKIREGLVDLADKIRNAASAKVLVGKQNKLRFTTEKTKERIKSIQNTIDSIDKKIKAFEDIEGHTFEPLTSKPIVITDDNTKVPEIKHKDNKEREIEIILIGISTGGPASLNKIIPNLPKNFPCSIIIAQHMPPGFTKSLAGRLNQVSHMEVKEAEDGEIIKSNIVYVAPSGFQTRIKRKFGEFSLSVRDDKEGKYMFKPCINVLFSSAAETYKNKALGIIMTGMGNDGTLGSIELKSSGGKIFAQSEESCVIGSMPKSVIKEGVVDRIIDLENFSSELLNLFGE